MWRLIRKIAVSINISNQITQTRIAGNISSLLFYTTYEMNKRYNILSGLLVTSDVKFILMRHDVIDFIRL